MRQILDQESSVVTVDAGWGNYCYRNGPKFSERANSVDPDQIAPTVAVWSGCTLFAIPSASFGRITLWKIHISQMFWITVILGVLRKFATLFVKKNILPLSSF